MGDTGNYLTTEKDILMSTIMNSAEQTVVTNATDAKATVATPTKTTSLRESVTETVKRYYEQVEADSTTNVYEMVLAEIEEPLLEETMKFTRGNQSRAAVVLGLSRGTLRKLLKKYDLD